MEIITHYPNNHIYLKINNGKIEIERIRSGDILKISYEDITKYMNEILEIVNQNKFSKIRWRRIDFKNSFVCLENFRDIMEGIIDKLIDNNDKYESNLMGSFGFLFGKTKPIRIKFIEYANKHPNRYKYISTKRYKKDDPTMLSWIDIKKKFKYLINLPGHTYCTKIYTMLFCKRLIFYSKPNLIFEWENKLEPWIHYVPIESDLNDLEEKYEWAENNPEKVKMIINNAFKFGVNEMGTEKMKKRLSEIIKNNLTISKYT